MKKCLAAGFLLVYWLLAQLYVVVAFVRGAWLYWGEKTPFSHAFVEGFCRLLFKTQVEYVNPEMREKIRAEKQCMLLYNHRSVADFTVSMYTTAPDRLSYVSRMAVFWIFPLGLSTIAMLERNAIMFYRGRSNREKLKRNLFARIEKLIRRGLFVIVFPEGHRNTQKTTLPLKRGAIDWAYDHGVTCAVVLHDGNENMVNEKALSFNRGVKVRCLHKGLYHPRDYSSRDAFFDTISAEFAAGYAELIAKPQSEGDE